MVTVLMQGPSEQGALFVHLVPENVLPDLLDWCTENGWFVFAYGEMNPAWMGDSVGVTLYSDWCEEFGFVETETAQDGQSGKED